MPWRETPIIVNLYGEDIKEFEELTKIVSQRKEIAALEVNISCPNVKQGGMQFGQDEKKVLQRYAKQLKKIRRLKGGDSKTQPNVSDIKKIAKAVESAGADCISLINTIPGMAVDIYKRRPKLTNVIGGLSGPAIKPIALRMVYEVSQTVDIPVIGIGGISTVEDVFEFILVGAHAVQIGSANFTNPALSFEIVDELINMGERLNINSLEEFRGKLII